MSQTLNEALDGLVGTVRIARDLVAHFDYGSPILGCEVLVGCFGYIILVTVSK